MRPGEPHRRKLTRVAVGVLVRSDGRVLLADRPAGKPYAGYWEFPGGKIEPGEDVAVALGRELHEELGIDIGPSAPWVTFEFDYPHAYVELQFRWVNDWRGDPHAREGQRLDFFDPQREPPQPLLPAAIPALRWLLLPRTVLVTGLQPSSVLAAGAADSPRLGRRDAPPMIVADADWLATGSRAEFVQIRSGLAAQRPLLLAAGPGAQSITDADGVVLDPVIIARTGRQSGGLLGAWVGSDEELQLASSLGCDFVLVRSAALAGSLLTHSAPVPAYLPLHDSSAGVALAEQWPAQGRWIDLRPAD